MKRPRTTRALLVVPVALIDQANEAAIAAAGIKADGTFSVIHEDDKKAAVAVACWAMTDEQLTKYEAAMTNPEAKLYRKAGKAKADNFGLKEKKPDKPDEPDRAGK